MSLICQERNTKYEYLRFLVGWWNLIRRDYKFNVIMPTVIKLVKKNQKLHNSDLPFLVGEVKEGD